MTVYIRAPEELVLAPGYVLCVVKPLYAISESGLHLYLKYLAHHLDTLYMTRSKCDTCVRIRRTNDNLDGLILLQVDDSLGLGTNQFLDEEEQASKEFGCKPRTGITETVTNLNGINISNLGSHHYSISHTDKIEKLEKATTRRNSAAKGHLINISA